MSFSIEDFNLQYALPLFTFWVHIFYEMPLWSVDFNIIGLISVLDVFDLQSLRTSKKLSLVVSNPVFHDKYWVCVGFFSIYISISLKYLISAFYPVNWFYKKNIVLLFFVFLIVRMSLKSLPIIMCPKLCSWIKSF